MMDKHMARGYLYREANGEVNYEGEMLSIEQRTKVVMMTEELLNLLVQSEVEALLLKKRKMEKEFYEIDPETQMSFIPDEMIYYPEKSNQEYKLFLDRHFYTTNAKDYIFVRWANVDLGFLEEDNKE